MTRFFLAILFILRALSGFPQTNLPFIENNEHAHFYNLSKSSGLPSGLITDILQDHKGFIWIATDKGLSRFDGYRFINFTHNPDDSLSIPHNFVSSLSLSSDNVLYIATHAGICRFNRENTTFERLPGHGAPSLGHHVVRKILMQGNDTLFIENANGIFNRYILSKQQIDHFFHTPPSQPYYHYHCLRADQTGNIWAGGRMTGLYQYHRTTQQLNPVNPITSDSVYRQPDVTDLYHDSKGRYWLASINGFYQFHNEEGVLKKLLPKSTFSICEDHEKKLWLALGYGLARFDPEKNTFTIYNHHPSDRFSLADDYVNKVMCDQQGNIWAGTRNGISVLNPNDYQTVYLHHLPGKTNTLSHSYVTSLAEDSRQKVWIGTLGGGLNRWDLQTGSITQIKKESAPHRLASNMVKALYVDPSDNRLWVGLWDGIGFNRVNTETGEAEYFRINPYSRHSDWYNSFLRDSRGRFWLGIWGFYGMVHYNPHTRTILPPNLRNNNEPYNQSIYGMASDGQNIWMGTQPNHFYVFRENHQDYKMILGQPKPNGQLPENTLFADFEFYNHLVDLTTNGSSVLLVTDNDLIQTSCDNDTLFCLPFRPKKGVELPEKVFGATSGNSPNTWILITSRGIELIDFNQKSISLLATTKQISSQPITSINRYKNRLIITTQKEIYFFDLNSNKLTKPDYQPALPENEVIKKSHLGNQNTILLHTSGGIAMASTEGSWKWFNLRGYYPKGFMANTLLTVLSDSTGNLWLGTENGLYRMVIHQQDTVFTPYPKLNKRQILSLGYGPQQNLWVGTDSGPAKILPPYDPADVQLLNHPPPTQLTSHLIKFLWEDSNNNLWAGTTNAGVNLIDPGTFKVRHFTNSYPDSAGFWGHSATCILETKDGLIWMGGNGLNCYNPANGSFTHYTVNDGLPNNQVLTLCEDDSGELWIGFENGLGRYHPQTKLFEPAPLGKYQIPPHVAFTTSIKHTSGQIIFGGPEGLIKFDPDNFMDNPDINTTYISGLHIHGHQKKIDTEPGEVIHLAHDDNFITITFSNLVYPSGGQIFQYRMNRLDSDWKTATENKVSYNGIPPGKYTFEVKSQYSAPNLLILIIHPPFWRTWWFTLVWIAALAGVVFWILYQHINKLRFKNKSIELEQRLLRSQMNPHFVFNSLSAIQSFIFSSDPMEAGRYLSKFAKLMRLMLQNSRQPFIPLAKEIEALKFYLELQQLRWNNFNYEIITNDIDCSQVAIPPMMVQPFAENSIEHGLNSLKKNGIIEIKFTLFMSEMHIHIRDNGIGINASRQANKKNPLHQSLASRIANERLAMLNGGKSLYQLTIQDYSDINPQETGTLVTISLPFMRINQSEKQDGN